MPVPSAISELSTTPGSNSPSGSDSPSVLDDHQRTAYAFIKTLSDAQAGLASLTGNQTIAGVKTFSSTPVVPDDSFTFAKLQNIATATIAGRSTAGTGDIEALTPAQVASLLAAINPAFAATQGSGQTVTAGNTTICQFATETFDTTAAYDTTTYRYTPQVAGIYQVNASVSGAGSTTTGRVFTTIRKNGIAVHAGTTAPQSGGNTGYAIAAGLVSLNGTTDYIDVTGAVDGTGTITMNGGAGNGFSAFLVQRT